MSSEFVNPEGFYSKKEVKISYMFCKILRSFDVESICDLDKITGNVDFENEIRKILGQRKSDSLIFFYMYTGVDHVLPDKILKKVHLFGNKEESYDNRLPGIIRKRLPES